MFYARALLILIHLLYDLFIAIHDCCRIVQRKCCAIICTGSARARADQKMLREILALTDNLPRHVVIVLGERQDDRTFIDCASIVGWCLALGIPNVSFFDTNGFFVRNEKRLKQDIAAYRPEIEEHITWGKSNTSPVQNGKTDHKRKVRVSLLSREDGKGEIVSLTKELAKAVTTGGIKLEEINEHLLNEKLKLRGLPNPELAVIYGRTCSSYGLLPWHTATTEFFTLPLYHSLSLKDFARVLLKYSQCVQRYGK